MNEVFYTQTFVEELRPTFKLDSGMEVVDWFEVKHGHGWCIIKSGLRHADGETKSPYHYEQYSFTLEGGLKKFTKWWNAIKSKKDPNNYYEKDDNNSD